MVFKVFGPVGGNGVDLCSNLGDLVDCSKNVHLRTVEIFPKVKMFLDFILDVFFQDESFLPTIEVTIMRSSVSFFALKFLRIIEVLVHGH